MPSQWTVLAFAAVLGAALPGPQETRAQAGGPEAPPDSGDRLAAARQAQARFERVRLFRLPWSHGGASRECHERVGRYCVWHDRTDDEWVAPREHRDVSEARDVLLAHLREALQQQPGDAWISGQRVSYLLDAGRPDDALDAARSCGADPWWCAALEGLIHHTSGRTLEAERSFERAMSAMPPGELARWTDPRLVLPHNDDRRLEAMVPAARDSLAVRLWWLADPLWMREGNDRRTEHLSRLVRVRLSADARNTEGVRWGRDLEQLMLRFGWPSGWERRGTGSIERRVSIVTHRAPFGREFIPPLDVSAYPDTMPRGAWSMTPPIPTTEYAPSYARFEGRLGLQLAVIPDGDSAVIAAAFALEHDSVAPGDSLESALIVGTPTEAEMDSAGGVAGRSVRVVRVARRDLVASVEALIPGAVPRAARARLGVPLVRRDSTAIVLSDPLLIDPEGEPPARGAAIRRMVLPSELAAADSIGVYFEASRLAPDVPVEVELTLEPERSGGLRRFGESIGLVSRRTAVRLSWQERPPAHGRLTRAVTLGFGDVPDGRYTLHLRVRQDSAYGSSSSRIERGQRARD